MLSARVARVGLRATAQQFSVPRTAALNGVRTFASAQDVRPPVALYGVDGTYATALYTASVKSSALDQISQALANLDKAFKQDKKLSAIVGTPMLSASDKQQIIQELQKVAGGAGEGEILKHFLNTLAENNRLGVLGSVCEKFETIMGAHRGEVELNITSAQELDSKSISRLEKAVSKSQYSQGKKLKVVTSVNPDLVGGLVVNIGDRTIDLSVASKLARYNKTLTEAL